MRTAELLSRYSGGMNLVVDLVPAARSVVEAELSLALDRRLRKQERD